MFGGCPYFLNKALGNKLYSKLFKRYDVANGKNWSTLINGP